MANVEWTLKAKRFEPPAVFTTLLASSVKSASEHCCIVSIIISFSSLSLSATFVPGAACAIYRSQQMIKTGSIVLRLINIHSATTAFYHHNLPPPPHHHHGHHDDHYQDYTKRFAAHCSVCKMAIVPKEGQTKVGGNYICFKIVTLESHENLEGNRNDF